MQWCDPYGWHNTPNEQVIVAWAPPSDEPPMKLHCPFWAKKANQCVVVQSLHGWAEQQIMLLSEKAVVVEDADEQAGIGALTNGTPHSSRCNGLDG